MQKRSQDRQSSLDVWVERILLKDAKVLASAQNVFEAVVSEVSKISATVLEGEKTIELHNLSRALAVGDRVRVGMVDGEYRLVELLPRRTKLSRPDVGNSNQERVIVANVDVVIIVVSVVSPPLHPRLIDRYLVAVRNGGAQAMVCVNKIDLLDNSDELEALEPYRKVGVPIHLCSTVTGDGIEAMREELAGKTIAFVGHSGVGKSSLANGFAPELDRATGSVSEGYGRGTHTTTSSSLHRLSNGTVLIDTPGIRSFGLWDIAIEDLAAAFPEIFDVRCRFSDCKHESEPGCMVHEGLESGAISWDRYELYLRMASEVGS